MLAKSFDTALEKPEQGRYERPVRFQNNMVDAMTSKETLKTLLTGSSGFPKAYARGSNRGVQALTLAGFGVP